MSVYDEGVKNLEQLEDILIRVDDGRGYITRQIVVAVLRAVWWLMKRWVIEHDPGKP